jgi:hypothetical protein
MPDINRDGVWNYYEVDDDASPLILHVSFPDTLDDW